MPCLTGNEINRQKHHGVILFPGKEMKMDLPKTGYMGIPGIECLGGKKLAVVFYGGGDGEKPGNFISWRESKDGGVSWSDPVPAVVPMDMERQRVFDPCLWLAPDRKLWLFFASAYQKSDHARVMAGVAVAPYRNWRLPRHVAPGIMMNKPIVLQNGSWALPVSRWQNMKLSQELPPGSSIYSSEDNGKSFIYRGTAQTPPCSCNENVLLQRRDGSLWMLSRNAPRLAENFSDDAGLTWSAPAYSSLYGADSRFAMRRLNSGRILLVNHEPVKDDQPRRAKISCALSEDEGYTWKWRMLIDPRAEISYPDFSQDEDGHICLIYDRDRFGDRKLVFCKFSEAEIMAGERPELLEI